MWEKVGADPGPPYRPRSSSRPRSRRGPAVVNRVGSPPWRRSASCSPTLRGCDNPARRTASRAGSGNACASATTLATPSAVTNSRVGVVPPLPSPISLSSAGVGFSARLHPGCRPWAANRSRAASARARGAPHPRWKRGRPGTRLQPRRRRGHRRRAARSVCSCPRPTAKRGPPTPTKSEHECSRGVHVGVTGVLDEPDSTVPTRAADPRPNRRATPVT